MTTYKVNEIFHTLQGEGYFVGTPSVFVRFSGCNLHCPFCDTAHDSGVMMTNEDILRSVARFSARHVVLTGGEPSLFVTDELLDGLHRIGRYIAIETNGTRPIPKSVDWITLSPKDAWLPSPNARPVLDTCDELKVIFNGDEPPTYDHITARHRFIQPCDTGNPSTNKIIIDKAVAWCLFHPTWRLSLQTHKLINIP